MKRKGFSIINHTSIYKKRFLYHMPTVYCIWVYPKTLYQNFPITVKRGAKVFLTILEFLICADCSFDIRKIYSVTLFPFLINYIFGAN